MNPNQRVFLANTTTWNHRHERNLHRRHCFRSISVTLKSISICVAWVKLKWQYFPYVFPIQRYELVCFGFFDFSIVPRKWMCICTFIGGVHLQFIVYVSQEFFFSILLSRSIEFEIIKWFFCRMQRKLWNVKMFEYLFHFLKRLN